MNGSIFGSLIGSSRFARALTVLVASATLLPGQAASADVKIQTQIPSVTTSSEWRWVANSEKVPELFSMVTLQFPAGTDLNAVTLKNGSQVIGKSAGALRFLVPGLTETIQGVRVGGGAQPVQISISGGGVQVSEWGCKNYDLVLDPQGKPPLDTYVGIACKMSPTGELLAWISIPREAGWGSTTLFEDAGKGERWHQYTIPKYERSTTEKKIGSFNFTLNDVPYAFNLVQRPNANMVEAQKQNLDKAQKADVYRQQKDKLEKENRKLQQDVKILASQQQKKEEPVVRFRGGVGLAKIGMKTADFSPSTIQPLVMFGVRTKPVFIGVHVGGQVKYAVAIGTSSQAFYDIFLNLGPSFGDGSFSVDPVVGILTMGQDYDPGRISFRHTNTALGLAVNFGLSATSALRLEALLSGMIPAGESKYTSFGASFEMGRQERVSWSLGVILQQTKYDKVSSSFDQTMGLVQLHF